MLLSTRNTAYLVLVNVDLQILVTLRIEIVGKHSTSLLGGRQRKRTNSGKNVRYDIILRKRVHKTCMLSMQSRIPINFGKVKCELAIGFALENKGSIKVSC